MTMSVVLDLSESVSVNDLQQFLAFAPLWHDNDQDIRVTDERGLSIRFLELQLPPNGPSDTSKSRLAHTEHGS
ncbi:hypothetical protein TV39_08885 [Arthrobacter sp. SPG23]|nr:hypothetical protein TV39_08885 [Arthrobacter sp. SPG23]